MAIGCSQGIDQVIANGFESAALQLIDVEGAKLEYKGPDGESFLHMACDKKMYHLVRKLVREKNFNLHQRDKDGKTALHYLPLGEFGFIDAIGRKIIREFVHSVKGRADWKEAYLKDETGNLPDAGIMLYWRSAFSHRDRDVIEEKYILSIFLPE